MDNTTIKFITTNMPWKNVLFKDIVERVALTNTSENLPYIEFEDIISGEGTLNKDIHNRKRIKKGIEFIAGDVLFGKLRPYLKNIFLANLHGIAIGDFWVLRSKNILPYILYLIVNSKKFMQVVSNQQFSIPAMEEQRRIASYFQSMDTLIQTTSKKLTSLKQIKVASLQSMFPQDGETKPRVRFKGFDGEWKEVQLKQCLDICNDRNTRNIYGIEDVLSISDEAGVVNQIKFLGRSFAGKSVTNYKILHTNQIVYTKSPLKAKPYGIIKENTTESGIVSVLYAVYNSKENVSPEFIHYYFDPYFRINRYLLPLVNKGAKNTMNISDETALLGRIWIPTLQEQQKIASYFCNLDRQITLQTSRLEKLKQIKAACLDKMFV